MVEWWRMDVLTLIQAISHLAANCSCACWRSHSDKANRTTSPAKSRDVIWRFPKRTSSWKSKNRTDDREPWWSPAHIEKVFVFVLRTQTQISLWFIRTWWKQLWAIYLWTWFVITSSPQAQSPITKLWFRSGSQFLTWALKLEPLPRPHLKTQRTAVLFHIHRQQSESYPMWLKLTRSDSLAQHNSDA